MVSASATGRDQLLRCAAELADPIHRLNAAQSIARHFGADDLIVFVRDPVIRLSLPAPGFPQTLREGRMWRELIDRAIANGTADGEVVIANGDRVRARAAGLSDGTVLALTGIHDAHADLTVAITALPIFGALFRVELEAANAFSAAALARQSAMESAELTTKLDRTRADLQRALAVAETATRARDEFLATVSHELRTPLTSIIGWLQLVRGETRLEVLEEAHETIDRNARAQSRLIEDILDFSRINAGKLRLDVRAIDLVDVIKAAIDVVQPAADAKGVSLDCVLDPQSGFVSGDPDRLQQVAWNLLSNAVKFTQRGGRVQVRLERVNSHSQLSVSDTGQGIAPEFIPHVFDRFSQADSTSTRAHGGLGLGLGIVRHLVELHGGTVRALSPGLGHGSTFTVRLPLMVAHQPQAGDETQRNESADELSGLDGVRVLIVEDNDDARKLLCTILDRAGAAVTTADSVAAALEILKSLHPDLIVSDIEMPGEDGYSLMRKLRLDETLSRQVPAIALTAYARGVDRVRALAAGFQMHMTKPAEPAELVAAIKSLVAATRTPRQ